MSESQPAFWITLGLMLVVGLWLFIGAVVARIGGWRALAARYPARERPPGRELRGQVVGFAAARERGLTILVPGEAGLYLYTTALFRFRRPPIMLPWREIAYQSRVRWRGEQAHQLRLAGGLTCMRVRDAGFRELAPFLSRHGIQIPAKGGEGGRRTSGSS